ncbi:hypothetical protein ACFQE5_09300 [Pseudonocardia hispaniensis]|uniref:Thioredoxin domain-containing protein n=1 Tax=Pseudonocardia hispaniensis TaxID=904933 RepID=A0ABW1J1P1_9PSEU
MSLSLAVALLALLVALFTLVALVAVYARLRALEAGRRAELSGYAPLVGRAGPATVRPRPGERLTVVAVLDTGCALCRGVWDALRAVAAECPDARFVGLVDRPADLPDAGPAGDAELLADLATRADLYEGYSPTVLVVDAAGTIVHRSFIYSDTNVRSLLSDLTREHEVTTRP